MKTLEWLNSSDLFNSMIFNVMSSIPMDTWSITHIRSSGTQIKYILILFTLPIQHNAACIC